MREAGKRHERCAQSIALLKLLGRVPELPSRNPLEESSSGSTNGYVLPPRIERGLTSILASLSSINDNFERVSAVCVRERDDILEVLIASNAWGPGESTHLTAVEKGLRGLFDILGAAHTSE
jgi:hypothetical protein